MTRPALFVELADLCDQLQRAGEEAAAARAALQVTCAQTRQLIAEAQQTRPLDWCASVDDQNDAPPRLAKHDSYEAVYAAANAIRDILEQFPLYVQIAIVKALGARAALLAYERRKAPPSVLSA